MLKITRALAAYLIKQHGGISLRLRSVSAMEILEELRQNEGYEFLLDNGDKIKRTARHGWILMTYGQ